MSAPRGGRAGGGARSGHPGGPRAPLLRVSPALPNCPAGPGGAPWEPRAAGQGRAQLRVDVGRHPARRAHTQGSPKSSGASCTPGGFSADPPWPLFSFLSPRLQLNLTGARLAHGHLHLGPEAPRAQMGAGHMPMARSGCPHPRDPLALGCPYPASQSRADRHPPTMRPGRVLWVGVPGGPQRGSCAPTGQSSPVTPIPQRVPRGWVGVPGCQFMGLGEGTQLGQQRMGSLCGCMNTALCAHSPVGSTG